jgi:hypothetical protein
MSSISTTTINAVPSGGSPLPPAVQPRPVIRRDDADRLLLNIIEARTTTCASDFESCMDHAYFIVNAMHQANRTSDRPTEIFSEMIGIINDARDAMFDTNYTDADGFPLDYVNQRAVLCILHLNEKYLELVNQTTQI